MTPNRFNTFVKQHAVDRWRERAAKYADEDYRDVLAAMEAATIVDKSELPSMMKPHDGTTFFRCKTDPPVYLAVEKNDTGNCDFRVATVLADLTSQPRRVRESRTGSIADEVADLTEEIAEIRKELDKLRAEKDAIPKGGRAEIGKQGRDVLHD